MAPTLYFLGTGSPETRGQLSEGGYLIKTKDSILHVDPGQGAAHGLSKLKINKVTALIITNEQHAHDANLIKTEQTITGNADLGTFHLFKKDNGYIIKHPDGSIAYITGPVKQPKEYAADVVILAHHGQEEKIITTIKPKLAILTRYNNTIYTKNPVYLARELQKHTGIQTIAAQDNLTVDLDSYSALAAQKSLDKFTTD